MRISEIGKARKSKERERLDRLLAAQETKIQTAFQAYIDSFDNDSVLSDIADALETGNIETALAVIDSHIVRMSNVLPAVFAATATSEMEHMAETLRSVVGSSAIGFDPTNPRAAELMRANKLRFVQEFTESQRMATRQALVRAFAETGTGPRVTARAFRESIGLTSFQENAVANYRTLLERNSAQALARDLRDRRTDRTLIRALETRELLAPAKIDMMVARYRQNYLQYRSEVIARTEGVRTTSLARQEATAQMVEDTGIDAERVVRVWNTTQDQRTRDAHAVMDGQEVGMEEPFIDGDGNQLMYPGDPAAPVETTAQCRCTFSIRVKEPE